jgi:hypothetical protein
MTKLYVKFESSEFETEQDAINALVDEEMCSTGSSLEGLIESMANNNESFEGDVFVFEVVDKGTIKSVHSFVSSKKNKKEIKD